MNMKKKFLEWISKISSRAGGHCAERIAMIRVIKREDFRSIFA